MLSSDVEAYELKTLELNVRLAATKYTAILRLNLGSELTDTVAVDADVMTQVPDDVPTNADEQT